MLKCPRCTSPLKTERYGRVEIETCPVCQGEWLDYDELRQVIRDAQREFTTEELAALDDAKQRSFRVKPVARDLMLCPKCETERLAPFNYAGTSGIILDKCLRCGGIWLDRHELEMVQALMQEWDTAWGQDHRRYGSIARKVRARGTHETREAPAASRFGFVTTVLRYFERIELRR